MNWRLLSFKEPKKKHVTRREKYHAYTRKQFMCMKALKNSCLYQIPTAPPSNSNGPPLKEQCVQQASWRESSIVLAGKLAAVQMVVIMAFGKLPGVQHLAWSKGKSCRNYRNGQNIKYQFHCKILMIIFEFNSEI